VEEKMKIILSKTHEESSKKASVQILRQVIEKNNAVLGFATGSSPVVIYENLIKFYKENIVSFKDVTAFNLDEYIGIEKSHQNSYYYSMRDNLFKHIDIKEENCHIENGLASDMNKECELYESLIEEKGGIDLQILGIGANGHIGFNEPSDKISPMTHVVELTQSTIDANSKYFSDIKMPTKAVTMGIATIMKSKKIILIASGEAKAKAIFDTVHGEITPEVPSSILRLHPDVTIYVDEDASKLLK
jgi:glucosamine-6-phosphate deaminase